ncbi:PREDICTED: endonuclease domain-containing 1 protein [Nanorana parkeri]|uniref:endonuclease domain-containing 1 protein n=1 Tax=Nanorana parkeri TaxID=125878 RepID=UPI000854B9A5|nr:PREDICTED: endonuclease domain-containing 1 protein [Nanorana parkeri]
MTALVVLVLAALPCLLHGRLVQEAEDGFAECNDFFLQGNPPHGFSDPTHARICQRYQGDKQFATLYSTEHKIPLYSAFLYREGASSMEGDWLLEPQLDDSKSSLDEATKGSEQIEGLGTNQALEEDYASSDYQPSPLFHRAPALLTNTVPLPQNFKEKWATDVDQLLKEKLVPQCGNGGNLHIIVGAVPSSNKMKDKVSIPEYVWLAAFCSVPEAWSLGVIKSVGDADNLEQVTLEELESRLPSGVKLFSNQCGEGAVSAEQRTSESATQTEDEGPARPGAFSRFFQLLFCITYEIVNNILCLVWFLVKQVLNLVFGRLYWIWTAATTYIFALSKVLLNIPCDVLRVLANILCGFVRILNNVFSAVCLLLRLPTRFLCDMASFPYYTVCAIPDVGIDILSGIWGVVALGFHAVFGAFGGSFSVASFAGSSFFSKLFGQSEGYENELVSLT